jgi:hypothetical protein
VLGETHLRRVLKSYARYYNEMRTDRSLDKHAPLSRPVQRTGSIKSHALLGGLHHLYVRVIFLYTQSTHLLCLVLLASPASTHHDGYMPDSRYLHI